MSNRGKILIWIFLSLLLVLLFFIDVLIGSVKIPANDILKAVFTDENLPESWSRIIWYFRFPKAITALLAGLGLSISGLQMQTIFRNPLAGPYVLGISAGASLGVAIMVMGVTGLFAGAFIAHYSQWMIAFAAWIGAGLILLLILAVSMRVKDIMTILILGIMFGSATSAIVNILQYFSDETMLKAFVVWTMGSLGGVSRAQLMVLAPGVVLGSLMALFSTKMLDAMLAGENYARSMGMNIRLSRFFVFFSTSILAGSVTAFCGPIGFVGIAVPHIARMVFNTAKHQVLLPGSMLLGGIVLLLSDIVSQLPGSETTLPINSITALIGIPVIIWIIVRNRKIMV